MKTTPSLRALTLLCAATALAQTVNAATNIWIGASGGDWLTPGNWSPSGPPGANDEARFFNPGAVADTTIDNVVSTDTTIQWLWIGQTNNNHNMGINAGATLTVTGTSDNGYGLLGSDPDAGGITPDPNPLRYQSTIYVGTKTASSTTQLVPATISGGGRLVVSNANNEILIRQFFGTAGGAAHRAILNLSGLDTFVAHLGRIRVGDGEAQPLNRSEGQMFLAKTNTVTLVGTNFQDNVQLVVGNNDVNQNQANPSILVLGGKNVINVDEVLVGGKKQPGTIRSTNTFTAKSLVLRGSDGVSRVRAFRLGDASDQPTSGNGTTGIGNFTDLSVDILADTISVGKSQSTGTGNGSLSLGNFLLGSGTLDVNTLDAAFRMDNCSTINAATGNLNFSNTTVTVNTLLRLGRMGGGTVPPTATLTISGGSVTVKSNVVVEGAASIFLTNAPLVFLKPASLVLNNLVLDGGSISNNAGMVRVTNTLNIANLGLIRGNPAFDMGNNPATTWNVDNLFGGNLTVSNSFQGGGTFTGHLVQGNGGGIGAGGNGTVGTLTINGNLTLNAGTLRFDLSNSGLSGNDQIAVSARVTANATNDVNLTAVAGGFDTVNPYTLITSSELIGNQNNFKVTGPFAQSRYTFAFDTTSTPNTVKLVVSGAGGANLAWVGDGSGNVWDTVVSNWNNGGANKFFTLDNVTFGDTGSDSPAVSLIGALIPGAMTVNSATKNYRFGGSGGLAASGSLIKSGTGSLTFSNSAANSFSSLVTISNGAVTFSNNGQDTFSSGLNIYGGSATFLGNSTAVIVNVGNPTVIASGASLSLANANANNFGGAAISLDGTLSFDQAADSLLSGDITGAGTLIKNGNGTLTISGNNSALSSVVQINSGTVKAASTTALGFTGVTVTNSATLDLVGRNLGTLPVTASGAGVAGNGAITSTGAPLLAGANGIGLGEITLAGNTTFGASGPWDTDPVKNLGVWGLNGSTLSTGGNAYSLTKVGSGQVGLSGATIDDALGHIDVQQGLLAFQGGTSSMGNPASNIIVRAGATVSFFDTATAWDKKFVLFGNGVTANLFNYNGANTIIGPVTLNGNCVIGAAPSARGTPISLAFNGPIGGTGSLIKGGQQDAVVLHGTNNYAGNTVVNSGKLVLSGKNIGGGLLTNTVGTTISGVGSNSGPVAVNGTLSPGDDATPVGTFGTGPLTLNNATLAFDVDASSDLVEVNGNLGLNGTIGVQVVPGSSLTVGQNIPLIHWSGSMTGNTNSLQLLPLPPGFTLTLYSNANTIGVTVGYVPVNKTWRGGAVAGPTFWDTTTTNWDNAGSPDKYNSGDFAIFDDTRLTNVVSIVGSLLPAAITVSSSGDYYFGGSGKLTGVSRLDLSGAGSLTITNSGVNDFTGPITLGSGAGILFVGGGGANGNLGSGPISNFTAVVFNKSGTNTVNNNFFETGVVTNKAGVLVLGGDNSLADMNITVVSNSTLRPATATALGRNLGTTLIEFGGVLDVNGQNLGAKSVTVSGSGITNTGAIINSGAAQISALQHLILQTNVTFGGVNRWDLRAGTASTLDTANQPYNITKVGPNQVSLVSITNIDAALADIDIQQGTFSLQNFTGQLGDPTRTLTVRSNAVLHLFNLNLFPLDKTITMANSGTISNESGASVIIGPVSLTGKATFAIGGTSLSISNNNALTGAAVTNLVKSGAGTLALVNNSLPSITLVDLAAGTLDLSQASSPTLTLASGQTLKGSGTLVGFLVANPGSTVSPGASIGTLTVTRNVTLAGTTFMELNKTTATSDLLRATNTTATTITYGGTLVLTNLAGTLAASNTFRLFSATNYAGAFSAVSPATPAPGLGWNTNTLATDGILRLVSTVNTTPTNITLVVAGNQLTLSWPPDHLGWRLQVQTNSINVGLRTNWVDVAGSTTVSNVSVTINRANGTVFYRMVYP